MLDPRALLGLTRQAKCAVVGPADECRLRRPGQGALPGGRGLAARLLWPGGSWRARRPGTQFATTLPPEAFGRPRRHERYRARPGRGHSRPGARASSGRNRRHDSAL